MRRLRSEDGIALAVAMITITLIGILSAIFASSAVQLGDSSDHDRDTKRALGAAEAGMNTALHRIAQEPLDQHLQCYAQASVSPVVQTQVFSSHNNITVSAGQCPPSDVGRAGNGGSYFYFVTPVLKSDSCNDPVTTQTHVDSLYALAYAGVTVLQRCVTSFGTVNGVTRRVQRRVYATLQLFSGLVADDRGDGGDDVAVSGGANLGTTRVGTNGKVVMSDSSFSGQLELHRSASHALTNVTGVWTEARRDIPWVLNEVDPAPAASAHDHSITCAGPLLDALCASAGWLHGTHTFDIRSGYTVTLSGGTYYACRFTMSGGTLQVLAPAKIFVDSPSRPGSSCSSGGGVSWTGGLMNTAGAAVPSNLQLYVYGAPDAPGTHAITLEGTSTNNANVSLYAPTSAVTVRRRSCGTCLTGPTVKGSIAAHRISISGSGTTFAGDPPLGLTLAPDRLLTLYRPDGWLECRSQPTTQGDPESGCPV